MWKVVPFGRDGRRGALSVRRGEGGGSCGASWWSMTTGHTRLAIGIWLEPCGFRAADGDESGLAALNDGTFDLMIVDVFMPHMRGFESIVVFHGHAPTVPLIAMSGYAFANLDSPAPDFLRMALELGAARCVRKPFTPGALLAVVNECLAEAGSRFSGVIQSG